MIEVVGIGASGWASLGAVEQALVTAADVVLGGRRHLELLPDLPGQERIPFPRAVREELPGLLAAHAGARVVVLASGDPLTYGVGGTLIELFGAAVVRIHPSVSSVALAAARMGWPYGTYEVVRVGGELDAVRRWLAPGRRLMILSRDGHTPAELRRLLDEAGYRSTGMTVFGDLGAPDEARIEDPGDDAVPDLNLICLTCVADDVDPAGSVVPGLPDDLFDHDGQLTKRPLRAAALAELRPAAGELLWDVGAGSGSIGIEWARTHPGCRTIAVERDSARAKRIALNAARLGVPELLVVEGSSPDALVGLPPPRAVFVGGGANRAALDTCWSALGPGGRLVVHAVTLQTESLLAEFWRAYGGSLTRLAVETMEPLGSFDGWRPARAVVQWSATKP